MPIAKSRIECLQIRKLLQCIRQKDRHQIELLIEHGIPHLINYNEPTDGNTPLGVAVADDDRILIKYLIELGAHPDVVNLHGKTAIMIAAELGFVNSFEELLFQGANLNIKDFKGESLLFHCIKPTENHLKIFNIALENNIDVNMISNDGLSALYFACKNAKENEEFCLGLLRKGALSDIFNKSNNRTILMEACLTGGINTVKELLKYGSIVNKEDKNLNTASHEAAKYGSYEILALLSAYNADFNICDRKGNTPIHYAADGHASCIKFLSQRGCNPKTKNLNGDIPRNIAKLKKSKACIKELRKAERLFGKQRKMNDPWALHLYDWCFARQNELIELFKKYDPDDSSIMPKDDFFDVIQSINAPIDEEIKKQIYMLHDKTKSGSINYKDFLTGKFYVGKLYLMSAFAAKKRKGKKKGGKKKGKKKRKLPMEICEMPWYEMKRPYNGDPPSMFFPFADNKSDKSRFDENHPPKHAYQDDSNWYLNTGNKSFVNLSDAAKHNDVNTIEKALKKGYAVDSRDKYYKTALMIACHQGQINVINILLKYGADINAIDNFKWTPLHHACHTGQLEVAELLLQYGANIDAVALNGATPLFRAIEASQIDLVQFLIKRGAKLRNETRKGTDVLGCAAAWAEPQVHNIVKENVDALPKPKGDKKGRKK